MQFAALLGKEHDAAMVEATQHLGNGLWKKRFMMIVNGVSRELENYTGIPVSFSMKIGRRYWGRKENSLVLEHVML